MLSEDRKTREYCSTQFFEAYINSKKSDKDSMRNKFVGPGHSKIQMPYQICSIDTQKILNTRNRLINI